MAREAGVVKVVYTSSVATMGFKRDGTIVDEDDAGIVGGYDRALQAVEVSWGTRGDSRRWHGAARDDPESDDAHRSGGFEADTHRADRRRLPQRQFSRLRGHRTQPGRCGRGRSHACGGARPGHTRRTLYSRRREPNAQADPRSHVGDYGASIAEDESAGHAVAMGFAFFDETFTGKLRGKEPRATVEAVQMGKKMMFASSAKAERELGFRVLPIYSAMRAAIEWFAANGYATKYAAGKSK